MGLFDYFKQPQCIPDEQQKVINAVEKKEQIFRKFRITKYIISCQEDFNGDCNVPIWNENGKICVAKVQAGLFSDGSLQGSMKLNDGRLLNINSNWVSVKSEDYIPVLEYHKKYLSSRPYGYSGISVQDDKVISALAWRIVPDNAKGLGYGVIRGMPHTPFKTLAVDMGLTKKSEPIWKGKGGIISAQTKVFIKELQGLKLPDGTSHDGLCTAIDNGGGIFGAHIDVFCGTRSLSKQINLPQICNVSYEGIEIKIPDVNYSYGLYNK